MLDVTSKKKISRRGDFIIRIPKKEEIIEYVYIENDGSKTVIPRCELSVEVDDVMYKELKKESNNNEVEFHKHRSCLNYSLNDYEMLDKFLEKNHGNDDIVDEVFKIMQSQKLKKAIDLLLPQQKKVLYKKFCEKKTNTEIAKEEGRSEAAIRNKLRKIYNKLQKQLE
ncbi:sigma factor-like helix-turn-helix DNA-binding protein [Clostridium grantii]|uniref:RNA polymerase sigma factor, sigma-70 family n=1 Tax=Clostridium grantii DSM 8605 TaxID=1121316 RepID=A0A1M5XMB6_9CLOT|nr:sigma factor-like helix-turn-helix DNA-binding protein [Clostridium grantii]SHI00970.1 RNA polymerase sigma factor, sigma-70 family [Clostridium grantii DSM 8605]